MVIGITGNSGTGKSEISKKLKEELKNDYKLIDADKVAKELAVPGEEYFNQIVKYFGKEILLENGFLDRKKLSEIVFKDKEKLDELNKLTFKYVVEKINNLVINNKNVIIDAPLLIEGQVNKICDIVISIIAEEDLKIERICKRDNIDKKDAKKRLDNQPSNEFYIKNSDYVFNNSTSIDEIVKEIIKIIGEK